MNFSRARRVDPIVDMTPLIDIIFQLVLFFMVSTTFISAPGIEVDLPRSSADTVLRDQDDLSIWVAEDGAVYVEDRPVNFDGLKAALDVAAAGLARIRQAEGPKGLAGFGSAKGSNEEAYLFQKLVRTGF